ncbi:hypothetical protein BIW11_04883 [Tropilaelaps mercedesae]|uniref:Uncharacterized protein n=1 Tax=Tropilaelaps mercedesae TaxID=418985 RepID=A0A1V9X0N0_9ACAR|nr:hypothetical protein BIW11_04883 [Tropilaelaps mercedesae]
MPNQLNFELARLIKEFKQLDGNRLRRKSPNLKRKMRWSKDGRINSECLINSTLS